jgi:hypothetical protein
MEQAIAANAMRGTVGIHTLQMDVQVNIPSSITEISIHDLQY